MTAIEVLEKYWGYNQFRPLQEDIIKSILQKNDTLAVMPTGGGKSVCFQVPAMMNEGICIVVSPLIALMKDQVSNLQKKGILSLAIHSGLKFHEVKRQFENAVHGNFKFFYVSPERLETSLFLEYLPYLRVNLIAVDEAHCISQWGYDFRPSYLKIAALRKYLPDVPILALTASATQKVQKDICDKLEFKQGHKLFATSYDRSNLSYSVFTPPSKENKIIEVFNKVSGSGIAYCRSRKRTKELSAVLQVNQINADFYHAGLTTDTRNQKQDDWIRNKTRIICCTNAFGMGIDKPDVRSVVHFDLPDALEYYYQEAGRAGRDGKKSYAVLIYHPQEIDDLKSQIPLRFPGIEMIKKVYSSLCSFLQLPSGKGRGQSFNFEPGKFVENYKLNPILVTSVLKILEQEEVFVLSDNMFIPSTVEFFASKETLQNLEKDFPKYNGTIKGLLRSYEGIFEQPCYIDEFSLARFIGLNKNEVIQYLDELHHMNIIEYIPRGDSPKILFLIDRVPSDDLIVNEKNIALRKKAYEERLAAMTDYATQKEVCRSIFINKYFGGKPILPCGICDICLSQNQKSLSATELQHVIEILKKNTYLTLEEIEKLTKIHKKKITEALQFLKQENLIVVEENGTVKFNQT